VNTGDNSRDSDRTQPDLFAARSEERPPSADLQEIVRGEVLHIVFAGDDGQYVVARFLTDKGEETTVVGPLGGVLEGQEIEAAGRWENHRRHGRQFRVERFRALLPRNERGILRYLASGLIPGIGPKLAERIVRKFGIHTLDILDRYSARLKEVPGIGAKRIRQIREAWRKHQEEREVRVFLQGLGLGPAACTRLLRRYGMGAAEIVRRDPYILAREVHGFGFKTADAIAAELGVPRTDPTRLAAGVTYVLQQLADDGHVCFPRDALLAEAAQVLDVGEKEAGEGLRRALLAGTVVNEEEVAPAGRPFVYLRELYEAERDLAEALKVLLAGARTLPPMPVRPGGPFWDVLDEDQRRAVLNAFEHGISVITGGPGVGKTTVVGQIVSLARRAGRRVLLAAPTGRAARRLKESCAHEARTIHRMLRWDPGTHRFVHGPDRPLKCDLLVVDETSMLDVTLAAHLFRAVSPGTRVVLVGDRDQLPSVGPGNVLHDIIACGRIPVTHLRRIYRQEEASRIVLNAHRVNAGEMPDLRRPGHGRLADFYWIDQEDRERVAELIVRMVVQRIPERFGFSPWEDIQVLAPMHRGACGASRLNQLLQKALVPEGAPSLRFGADRVLHAGDRVMQTANNYDKGVFNGEMGRIIEIDATARTFKVAFDVGTVEYDWVEASQVQLAYAVTVHKSQGSEFPAVVLPVLTQHYIMLQRNLIYTAMTRARKLLIMIGTRRALAIAVRNARPAERWTLLTRRLQHTGP